MARLSHRTAPGCTYFVTTKTWGNRGLLQIPENAAILAEVLLRYRSKGTYGLHEFVAMPNHLHLRVTPDDKTSLEKAMQLIKKARYIRQNPGEAKLAEARSRALSTPKCNAPRAKAAGR